MRSIYTAIREVVEGVVEPELPKISGDSLIARHAVGGALTVLEYIHSPESEAMSNLRDRVIDAEEEAFKKELETE